MSHKYNLVMCVSIGLLMSAAAWGADHAKVMPYITDDVAAIGYVDLAAVDTANMLDGLRQLSPVPTGQWEDLATHLRAIQGWTDQLVQSGATRIYVLFRASDLRNSGPICVLPLRADADAAMIIKLMQAGPGRELPSDDLLLYLPKHFQASGSLVLGAMNRAQLERAASFTAETPREHVSAAMTGLGEGDLGLIVIGDRDNRRVVREMFPRLPKPFDRIDGRLIAEDLLWGGVAINLPPHMALNIRTQASRSEVAEIVQQAAVTGLDLLKTGAVSPAVSPDFAAALELLKPTRDGTTVSVTLRDGTPELARLRELISGPLANAAASAQQQRRMNQFKQLALAAVNYESVRGSFVTQGTYDKSGQPLLSWRVRLLPYLDQKELYDQFHLDEPWDSPHNRELIAKMPSVFSDPDPRVRRAIDAGRTTFVAPVANETVFPPLDALPDGKPVRIRDITDGTSKTILFIEVVPERAVVWTQPEDWQVDLQQPLQGVQRSDRAGFTYTRCDGSAGFLPNDVDPQILRAFLTRAAGDVPE